MIFRYRKNHYIFLSYSYDINVTQTEMILNKMNERQWYVVRLVKVGVHLDQ